MSWIGWMWIAICFVWMAAVIWRFGQHRRRMREIAQLADWRNHR